MPEDDSTRFRQWGEKAGLPPGSLVHVGERDARETQVTVFDYDADRLEEHDDLDITAATRFKDTDTVTWVNVSGLKDVDQLAELGEAYGLHQLLLEDILNTEQRPKIEKYKDHIFLLLKMFYHADDELHVEQVGLVIGKNFVLSFQESRDDVFDPVRTMIGTEGSKVRERGPDYLAYMLMDAIVDNYFLVLEELGEDVEQLEETIVKDPEDALLQDIYSLKRDLLFLRKAVWPTREIMNTLLRDGSTLIEERTEKYLRDVYDHTVQVMDTLETYREMVSGMLDIYLSSISNRMNEVMKVLTVIGAVFIPLTFITGVYGMNFTYMPELDWQYGYVVVWGIMLVLGIGMTAYFKKRDWL